MKIEDHMIAKKDHVGNRKDGSPVIMIVTHGGLYAFFSKSKKGDVETLGMAPHPAIASWMAEKKAKDIDWNKDFHKNEDYFGESLKKNQNNDYSRLRSALFAPILKKSAEKSDYYIIYDTKSITIGIMHKKEIQKMLDDGDLYKHSFVRNINMNEDVEFISSHKDFVVG